MKHIQSDRNTGRITTGKDKNGEILHGRFGVKDVQIDTRILVLWLVKFVRHVFDSNPMPNIFIHIPKNSFHGDARTALVNAVNAAAAHAEQIPENPRNRMLCWVLVNEVDSGAWTCGGTDMTPHLLPCVAVVYLPAGVLTHESRSVYVKELDSAFRNAQPTEDKREITSSIVLHEVPDGTWGVNGGIWSLGDFARKAGFVHLQHLIK